jgi:hypothetical protein
MAKKPGDAPAAPVGQPSPYKPEFAQDAKDLCEAGATDIDLAEHWGVTKKTIRAWRLKHPEFREACRLGKDAADEEVVSSLYERAVGGDVTACIYWLNNRRSKEWRNRSQHEVTGEGGGPIKTDGPMSDLEVARVIARALLQAEKAAETPKDETEPPPDDDPDKGTESA